jgi:hypothetical protein
MIYWHRGVPCPEKFVLTILSSDIDHGIREGDRTVIYGNQAGTIAQIYPTTEVRFDGDGILWATVKLDKPYESISPDNWQLGKSETVVPIVLTALDVYKFFPADGSIEFDFAVLYHGKYFGNRKRRDVDLTKTQLQRWSDIVSRIVV